MNRRAVNLATLLAQTARRLPEHDAFVQGEQRWSWRQLDAAVNAFAAELTGRGIKPGDCVLLHSGNDVELVLAMFATWRVGAVLAPTNSRLTPADVAVIAGACKPVLTICHHTQPEHAEAVGVPALFIGAGEYAGRSAEPVPDAVVGVDDPAWYFFTSGTSGRPKAAVLTHDQMGFVLTNHLCDLMPGTTELDASLALAPLSHGAGVHMLTQVVAGARTVLGSASDVWELVETERISNMFTVPTILKKIAEDPAADRHDHSSLRYVIYAGAPMYTADQEHARKVLGDVLVQYYGLGEVTGNITVLPPREHGRPSPDGVPFGTCGRVRTGMQMVIRDPDGRELAAGETGEICVAGPAVCAGYLDNDEANQAAFRDGWFHTGDLGLLDEQGYLYITGRASDMYISGGSNIHPRDIEEKLAAHPGVSEVAVLGMPHPFWGEVGVAVWVAQPGTDVDAAALQEYLAPKLARYKLPKHFIQWPELPKSGYGKIVKRTIRERLLAEGWTA